MKVTLDASLNPARMRELVARLRKPAGDDPRFATLEGIRAHRDDFLRAGNDTLRRLHLDTLGPIVAHERAIREANQKKDHARARDLVSSRLLWYRLNDAIAWVLTGTQRHVMKRLCGSRAMRPSMAEQEIEPVFAALAELNSDPFDVALWNDATSAIDIGDFLLAHTRTNTLDVVELKTGKVNAVIADAIDSPNGREDVHRTHGEKAAKQFDRVARQHETMKRALEVINTDAGTDPFLQLPIRVREAGNVIQRYDEGLAAAMAMARSEGTGRVCVDGCLWIQVNGNDRPFAETEAQFIAWLRESLDGEPLAFFERMHGEARERLLFYLPYGNRYPQSLPLYLRGLVDEDIVDIQHWRLRVVMYLDWVRFADLFPAYGGNLTWTDGKRSRQAKAQPAALRPAMILGRLPTVNAGGNRIFMGDPNIVRILVDGDSPTSIAETLVLHASKWHEAEVES